MGRALPGGAGAEPVRGGGCGWDWPLPHRCPSPCLPEVQHGRIPHATDRLLPGRSTRRGAFPAVCHLERSTDVRAEVHTPT
jgi:hypothetical protein